MVHASAPSAPPVQCPETQGPAPESTSSQGAAGAARGGPVSMSCVIPCWDEAENLKVLLPKVEQILRRCAPAWEVIVVDDGSRDGSAALLGAWAREPGRLVLQLSRHFGKEAALAAGLEAARGQVVVTMDGDLQHPPELIPSFVERWRAGADVVVASHADRHDESWLKRLGVRGLQALMKTPDHLEIPPGAGDFRLMDHRVVRALRSLPERNRFMKGLHAWVGFATVAVPFTPPPRWRGHSHFGPLRLARLSLNGLTAFTTWPLRAVSAIGLVLALTAFAMAAFLAASHLVRGREVSGWAAVMVGQWLIAGLQMTSLGVVGEYVGRVFAEVKARPLFIVSRRLGRGLASSAG